LRERVLIEAFAETSASAALCHHARSDRHLCRILAALPARPSRSAHPRGALCRYVAPLAGYACAWLAHGAFEGNRPATFGHPLWSFYSDFRMLALWASGRLKPELEKALRS